MNPLISKLSKRAAEIATAKAIPNQPAAKGISDIFEAFAALIVAECADAADMAAGSKYPGDYIAEQLGFGKEEGVATWRMNLQEAQK